MQVAVRGNQVPPTVPRMPSLPQFAWIDSGRFMYRSCHNALKSLPQCHSLAGYSRELLFVVLRLHLLRRSLHDVVTNGTLHAVLVWIVVNDRKLSAKIVPGWRRCRAPFQRSGFPRVIRRRLAPEA